MTREQMIRAHAAATTSLGWFVLAGWDTLRVAGSDRASFLHNMCTNDIRGLAHGQGCEAFFTDVKGKIVAHGFIFADHTSIEVALAPGLAARLIAHLDRYIIREDVQLADSSRESAWAVAAGPAALPALSRVLGRTAEPLSAAWSHIEGPLPSSPHLNCRVARCDLLWCSGALVRCDRTSITDFLSALRIQSRPALEMTEDLWHAIRIESGWPLWGVDFDDANLPQEVNRDPLAIHFRKGCYLGQETVARIDALGHVNKKLVQVRFEGDAVPPPGASLFDEGQDAGRITSAAWSPRIQAPLALATVRRPSNAIGRKLRGQGGDALGEVIAGGE